MREAPPAVQRKAMDKLTELLIAEDAIHASRHIFSLPPDVLTKHILLPPLMRHSCSENRNRILTATVSVIYCVSVLSFT